MIRAEYFVLRTLPVITSLNPIILFVGNRRNLLRFWLRTEVRVLRFDLLHLLRIGLFRLGPRISLHILLAGCRTYSTCRSCIRRCWISRCLCRRGAAFCFSPLLNSLLPRSGRLRACRLTGNIRFLTGGRLMVFCSFLAFSCTGLICSSVLMRSLVFLHRTGLIRSSVLLHGSVLRRSWSLMLRRIRLGLSLSRVRFFRGVLAL